ncbi:MAG: ribonuclease HI [Firmicutes bacterium]|nr:ribonuclease HI [Bacillota bacterium]
MKNVEIYTDGACSHNPGPGGWGCVLIYGRNHKELQGAEKETTNQRMELMAAIQALEALKEPCVVKLFSDSAYLINAFNLGWLRNWQRNGWVNSKKQAVENQDLWLRLLKVSYDHQIYWLKVKGHAGNEFNERCDALARSALNKARTEEAEYGL